MPDLIAVFNSFATVLPAATLLVYAIIGLLGLTFAILTTFDAWQHAMGAHSPRLPSVASIPFRYALAGAMVVIPLLLWRSANTFVLGGQRTFDMFSYTVTDQTPYCQMFHHSLVLFFAFFGSICIATSAVITNGISMGRSNKTLVSPIGFFLGGLFLFFVDDIGMIIGNTIGMKITLGQICIALNGP